MYRRNAISTLRGRVKNVAQEKEEGPSFNVLEKKEQACS
jgi:hypothetical protein